ncbi:hypothetical protein EV714DRAFT_288235 [Schizophyllum commune]
MYVLQDNDEPGFYSLYTAHVMLFFSFHHEDIKYPCALVLGLWIIEPDLSDNGQHIMDVIHVDAILHGAHLIGAAGRQKIPLCFSHTDSMDCFKAFYVNKYADYHTFEIAY